MKVALLVVILFSCSLAIYAEQQKHKRQFGELAVFAPVIGKLLLSQVNIGDLIGKAVGSIKGLIKGKKGTMNVPDTTLVLNYNVERCHIRFGKRFIDKIIPREYCKATVSENHISKTSASCETHVQESALHCAVERELKQIQALAQKAAGR